MYHYSSYHFRNHPSSPLITPRFTRHDSSKKQRRIGIASLLAGLVIGSTFSILYINFHTTNDNLSALAVPTIAPPSAPALQSSANAPAAKAASTPQPQKISLPALHWPRELKIRIKSGQSIKDILSKNGVAPSAVNDTIAAITKIYDLRSLKAGQFLTLRLKQDTSRSTYGASVLTTLQIPASPTSYVKVEQKHDSFVASIQQKEIKKVLAHTSGTINQLYDGIYKLARKDGTPDQIIQSLIKAYSYDVDFQRDIKRGDKIDILYEQLVTEDDIVIGAGKILHADLYTKGKSIPIYYYSDGSQEGFYKPNGESIVKKLLRTPVDGARISSGFGLRLHPILGYSKMHKGVDFAAPAGTPIYAAGDGVVEYAGTKGTYGNFISIRHNKDFATAYAHCQRIAGHVKRGAKVTQGSIIGYVGSTGRSTGAHLHYEIVQNGKQVNPSAVKFAGTNVLSGKKLAQFKAFKQEIASKIAALTAKKELMLAEREN